MARSTFRLSLQTPRFLLRPLRADDATWIASLHTDPDVMRYIPGGAKSPGKALRDAEDCVFVDLHSLELGFWAIADRVSGEAHGWVALKKLNCDDIEVGYRIRRRSWGCGIATEAAARLLAYGFEDLQLDRIVAVTMPENLASQRVLAKLGMRLEKCYRRDGLEWCYFGLSRTGWVTGGSAA